MKSESDGGKGGLRRGEELRDGGGGGGEGGGGRIMREWGDWFNFVSFRR